MKEFKGVQADILNAKKKNQLVSAGAGSGKTTVMIEKISNLLLNGEVDVDNLLVVTFTVLAAQEMKERLVTKLKDVLQTVEVEKKERILHLIEKIDTASIDTIDGFASKTIRKYFYDLKINPNIEIISDATKDYYLTRAMKKTFDDYEKSNGEINLMLDLFGGNKRNLETLQTLILNNYYNIANIEDYEKFLDDCVKEYEDCVKSEYVLNHYICDIVNQIRSEIVEQFSTFSTRIQEKLKTVLDLLNNFNVNVSFKTNLKHLNTFANVRYAPSDYADYPSLKIINNKISHLTDVKKDLEKNLIDENYEEKNAEIIKNLLIFIKLLKNFINNYNKIKEKYNLIDFNDLNRLMLQLLKNENIKKELQNKFKYIFIDEYQDVNPLQDTLMKQLAGENTTVFMVGDVKQSIYGFRGSSPEWFLSKYDAMKQNKNDEDVFDMNINFRSSPTILNFINLVFNQLMTKQTADIDYKNDCNIEPQRSDIVDDKVHIMLVKENKENVVEKGVYSVKKHNNSSKLQTKDKEALLVAKIITDLVGSDFYDANLKQVRKLKYSDIAILTHSDKDANSQNLIKILKNHLIPLNLNNKLEVNESEIVKLILSILKCVNNTADDVDYLATFMSLTDLTIDDVITLRDKNFNFYENLLIIKENLLKNEIFLKINSGFEIINDILNASYVKTNRELIAYILNEKKLKYYILQKENGQKELQILEEFLSKLSPVEDALGLAEFVEVVESNVNSSSDFLSVDKEESVTLQTIHKSKGLEYPVVILFNSSKQFSYLTDRDEITFNSLLGLGFDFFDTKNRIKMDSLPKYAIRVANKQKGYKEELRLLYVALTRAKNKLFITGKVNKYDFTDIKKTSYANMFLTCLAQDMVDEEVEKETFKLELIEDVATVEVQNQRCERNVEVIGQDFDYAFKNSFAVPLKNTVTGINSRVSQEQGFNLKKFINKTAQYEFEDKAKVGVEYHSALEALNLFAPYEKNTDYELVDYNKIKLAHDKLSPLVKDAINVQKEADFMMYVPHCEIIPSDVEDKILIQGVVDLIIEKEQSIILVDYKFSSLPAQLLKEKYFEQLKLYKLAIEESFKKPVEHMFIYSINTGELV